MAQDTFNTYSRFYDMLNSDKDYVAEVDYILNLLGKCRLPGKNLLEFGSGTGIHGRLLANQGYSVTGIERSPEMIKQAEQTEGFKLLNGNISSTDLGCTFDAVISLFHVISYQTTNDMVLSTFSNASKHLSRDGYFIFDVWYSPAVYKQEPTIRVKYFKDKNFNLTRIAEPKIYQEENRVDVHYKIFAENLISGELYKFEESHPMRHFSLLEIDLLAKFTGFERVSAEEFLTGKSPSEQTWGVCFIFKKV